MKLKKVKAEITSELKAFCKSCQTHKPLSMMFTDLHETGAYCTDCLYAYVVLTYYKEELKKDESYIFFSIKEGLDIDSYNNDDAPVIGSNQTIRLLNDTDFKRDFDFLIDNKYQQCPSCNGYGSNLKERQPKCSQCNGIGLIP